MRELEMCTVLDGAATLRLSTFRDTFMVLVYSPVLKSALCNMRAGVAEQFFELSFEAGKHYFTLEALGLQRIDCDLVIFITTTMAAALVIIITKFYL